MGMLRFTQIQCLLYKKLTWPLNKLKTAIFAQGRAVNENLTYT